MYKNKEEKDGRKSRNDTKNKADDHSFSAFVKTKEEIKGVHYVEAVG